MSTSPPFSPEELATCLRVLEALARDPSLAPSEETLGQVGRRAASLYRKQRKQRRKVTERDHKREDKQALVAVVVSST